VRIAILLLVVSTSAVGADFRLLDFGASCAAIDAKEAALGNATAEWQKLEEVEMHAFKGSAFQAQVIIGYYCSNDSLLAGNYYFPKGDLEIALAHYEVAHKELASTYGVPFLDDSRWMAPMDSRWLQEDPRKYSTTWKTPRVWVHLSILALHDEGKSEGQWQLAIMYIKATADVSSNTSLERTRER
jgi:hypothetical protein